MRILSALAIVAWLYGIAAVVAGPMDYTRVPLPAADNAYNFWTNALGHLGPPDDERTEAAFRLAADLSKPLPTGDAKRDLAEWVKAQDPSLKQISKGIRIGKLQFPVVDFTNITTAALLPIRHVARLKTVAARLDVDRADFVSAAGECLDVYRMGRMVSSGEGSILHSLVGDAVQSIGLSGLRWLATQDAVPSAVLERVVKDLPEAGPGDPALAQTLRVEFSTATVPGIQAMGADTLGLSPQSPLTLSSVFDRAATLRLAEKFFARFVADALAPWPQRDGTLQADARDLVPAAVLDGEDPASFALAIALRKLNPDDPATQERLKRLGSLAGSEPNLMGRMSVAVAVSNIRAAHERAVKAATEVNMTRAFLGVRICSLRDDRLPRSLDTLVQTRVLPQIPVDLFSGKELRYSAALGIVWSVGPDGRDDGGVDGKDILLVLPNQAGERP